MESIHPIQFSSDISEQWGTVVFFRILPNAKETPDFETYFETKHRRTAKWMAKQYGLSYKRVRSGVGLRLALGRFFSPSKSWENIRNMPHLPKPMI